MLLLPVIGRHSQVGKAAVCKTPMPQFESGCRLYKPLYLLDRVAFFTLILLMRIFLMRIFLYSILIMLNVLHGILG